MDEQQIQLQIVQLVLAAMQGDQQATQQIQQIMQAAQLGDQLAAQIAQMIQAVVLQMQQLQVQAARFGAKLNYIKQLRGMCPEGYEMQYFKSGGLLCKRCMKKRMEDGGEMPSNPVDAFKCGRKMKKKACGGSLKRKEVTKALQGVKVRRRQPIVFDRRLLNLGNGRSMISENIFDYDNGYGNYAGDAAQTLGGRMIYTSPNGNDTIYYNYPERWTPYLDGLMPVAEGARDLAKAKQNFYNQTKKSTSNNPESDKARKRALKGK